MRTRLLTFWEDLRTSYWFLPGLLTVGAVILSFVTTSLDHSFVKTPARIAWLWRGGPDGARDLLSTLASSMITVAGVVFSITLVVLTLASSQFGPRLLRHFMRDLGNQVVLGAFVSTFLYCLLVLRTVHQTDRDQFVPHISVTCSLALAVINMLLLIYYIHHVSDSIQAENLIARVGRELEETIIATYPENRSQLQEDGNAEPEEREYAARDDRTCHQVRATRSGYLQAVDTSTLVALAQKSDTTFRLLHHPGDFVARCNPLVEVEPEERCTASLSREIEEVFFLGPHRTPTQDIDYSIHQLAEIAVRSLSPAVNDPYTTIACIDWLGAAMNLMSKRKTPSHLHRDDEGTVRIIMHTAMFSRMVDAAFNQIRQYGKTSVAVMMRLLETLTRIAGNTERAQDLEAVRRHAEMVLNDGRRSGFNEQDLAQFEQRFDEFLDAWKQAATRFQSESSGISEKS